MADTKTLANQLAQLLGEILMQKVDSTDFEASLTETYDANSMDVVDMVEKIERDFHVQIPNSDIGSFQTFGDVVRYVDHKTGGT